MPIQFHGIPPIVEGKDVLLWAPTAAGKTETYAAPLAERLLGDLSRRSPFTVLVVSPTRALANDLHRRLEERMDALGIAFGRYTGEHKDLLRGRHPEVAVATPEAFDSLLARRAHLLRTVRAVVLDEIHVLDGTPRGDQLRVLLHRLARTTEVPPQRIAASATVADPAGLAARYLDRPVVVQAGARRRLRARAFQGAGLKDVSRHVDALAEAGFRKVLLFCNTRGAVESFAGGLRGRTKFGASVFAHHGSLARATREHTERRFLDARAAVAVATLTLELGIDIGSVDYVLLLAPPPGVAHLLQRAGRGSRRTEETRLGYAFGTEAQRRYFRLLLARGAAGDLLAGPYAFRPGVLVQQALVLAGSRGHVTAEDLHAVLPPALAAGLPPSACRQILEAMAGADLLEAPRPGFYVLGESQERLYEAGRLHGNIPAEAAMEVVDRLTGDVVGTVAPLLARDTPALQLGGRGRRAVRVSEGRLLTDDSHGGTPARFTPRKPPALGFLLARAFAEDLGAPAGALLQQRAGTGALLLHGLGAAGMLLLSDLLEARHGKALLLRASPMALLLARPLDDLPRPSESDLRATVRRHEEALATLYALGPHHRHLPPHLRHAAARAASHLDAAAAFLRTAPLSTDLLHEPPHFWLDL